MKYHTHIVKEQGGIGVGSEEENRGGGVLRKTREMLSGCLSIQRPLRHSPEQEQEGTARKVHIYKQFTHRSDFPRNFWQAFSKIRELPVDRYEIQ